jgi:hypothetical protein
MVNGMIRPPVLSSALRRAIPAACACISPTELQDSFGRANYEPHKLLSRVAAAGIGCLDVRTTARTTDDSVAIR